MGNLLDRIARESVDFTPTMKRIADAILQNPSETVNLSITQLMNRSKVGSESTIVRFYRQLGMRAFMNSKSLLPRKSLDRPSITLTKTSQ